MHLEEADLGGGMEKELVEQLAARGVRARIVSIRRLEDLR